MGGKLPSRAGDFDGAKILIQFPRERHRFGGFRRIAWQGGQRS
jgi:hypothetical protein